LREQPPQNLAADLGPIEARRVQAADFIAREQRPHAFLKVGLKVSEFRLRFDAPDEPLDVFLFDRGLRLTARQDARDQVRLHLSAAPVDSAAGSAGFTPS